MLLEPTHPMEAMSTDPDRNIDRTSLRPRRKRKADGSDNNERLSKRLSLLNLEHTGPKLYVPVENPSGQCGRLPPVAEAQTAASSPRPAPKTPLENGDAMQVDNSKYKVYIYDLDDELSSESEAEDGRLVFLPDIEKHLRTSRIPPPVLPNSEGELAGKQLILYGVPSSLSVPREHDSVRKAIIEARQRLHARQQRDGVGGFSEEQHSPKEKASSPTDPPPSLPVASTDRAANSFDTSHYGDGLIQDDPDAMDLG